jgi:hypothetical protein
MESIWLFLAIIAIIVMLWFKYPSQEHMTNKDLLSTLSTFGEKGKKKDTPSQEPIYGPKSTKSLKSTHTNKKDPNAEDGAAYPDIYGPEITPIPGKVHKRTAPGKTSSDEVDKESDTYQYNPDLHKAFPSDGEPQPFLTDFSKFQH